MFSSLDSSKSARLLKVSASWLELSKLMAVSVSFFTCYQSDSITDSLAFLKVYQLYFVICRRA